MRFHEMDRGGERISFPEPTVFRKDLGLMKIFLWIGVSISMNFQFHIM